MKKEIYKYFKDLLDSCYLIKNKEYEDIIFWFYDVRVIRQKKLNKVLFEKNNFKNLEGELIFEQDIKNMKFYVKNKIWSDAVVLCLNINLDFEYEKEIKSIIKKYLKDNYEVESLYYEDYDYFEKNLKKSENNIIL